MTKRKDQWLLGMELIEATKKLDKEYVLWRVSNRDGKPCILTRDVKPDRLNFTIRDNMIVRVDRGQLSS